MENQTQPTYVTPDKVLLEKLSKWASFVGIMIIIFGALTCLGAIVTFGLSLVPGIITIILGLKLRNAKNSIEMYIRGNGHEINGIFEHLSSFFQMSGILIIIYLALIVLSLIIVVILGAALFNGLSDFGGSYY